MEARHDVRHQVQADQIRQPEDAGLRQSHRLAAHRVCFLDAQPMLQRLVHGAVHEERADAIRDEARRILADHDPLAQARVAHGVERLGHRRPRLRSAHEFQQPHVARRIEEVRDREVGAERLALPRDQRVERNRGGVRRDDAAGPAGGIETAVERRLDRRILEHGLDDPIHFVQRLEIILHVAGRHQRHGFRAHERRGVLGAHARERARGERAPIGGTGRNDVQQKDRNTRVGKLRGDSAPHGTRTDYSGAADLDGHERWRGSQGFEKKQPTAKQTPA